MSSTFGTVIIVVFVSLFVLVIIVAIIATVRRAQEIDWLKQHGVRVQASVTDIQSQEESYQVPHTGPQQQYDSANKKWETVMQTTYETQWRTVYYVVAQYLDPKTNQLYTFKSDRLMNNPSQYTPGSPISVLYDQNDPSRYYMEVA